MIQGFEYQTAELTTYEQDMLVPVIVAGLKTRIGAKNAMRSTDIAALLVKRGYPPISGSRVRKCINHIRTYGLVPHLIANSRGYFVATSVEEVERYASSLQQRANSILSVKKALTEQLSGKIFL